MAKTPPFHGGNTSSNLVPIISRIEKLQSCKVHTLETGGSNPPPAILMACSSVVERLTVNQDVAGSIPTLPVSMHPSVGQNEVSKTSNESSMLSGRAYHYLHLVWCYCNSSGQWGLMDGSGIIGNRKPFRD